MKKTPMLLLTALGAAFAHAQAMLPNGQPITTRPFLPGAAARNHVLLVNVADAIPAADFPAVAERVFAKVQINLWTNAIPKSVFRDLVDDPAGLTNRFGPKCCTAVFIERNAKGYSFLNAQGSWSVVNLRGLDRDKPDAATLTSRRVKMVLKGLAFACGGGATIEPKCSLYYDSFTIQGMDKTGEMITPMSYFPMLETLKAIGGAEILSPEIAEEGSEAPADGGTPAKAPADDPIILEGK